MSTPARTPQQVLAVLERDLARAFAAEPQPRRYRRALRRPRRGIVLLCGVVVACASTAAATSSIFSPSPPVPRLAPFGVDLAAGVSAGKEWELQLSRCERPAGSVSVLLSTATGGAGSACGSALQPPTTFYEPQGGEALAFGVVPSGTARVELALDRGHLDARPSAVPSRALAAATLPSGSAVYVVAVPRQRIVTALTAFNSEGELLLDCTEQRCARP